MIIIGEVEMSEGENGRNGDKQHGYIKDLV